VSQAEQWAKPCNSSISWKNCIEQGQLVNAAKLAASLAISGQTVARYLDRDAATMPSRGSFSTPWMRPSSRMSRISIAAGNPPVAP
jgi:hypothetical protein